MEWNTVKSPSQSQRHRNCNNSQIVATRLNKLRSPLREFVFMVSHHRATDECEEVRRVSMCRVFFSSYIPIQLVIIDKLLKSELFSYFDVESVIANGYEVKKKPKQNKIPNTIKINVWH